MKHSLCVHCLSLRNFAASLEISADHFLDYLLNLYRDYRGRIVSNGNEVFLNTEEFETDSIREWFRDWACAPVPDGVRPRLRKESRERIRLLGTILSTRFAFEAELWGVRAANDNRPPSAER